MNAPSTLPAAGLHRLFDALRERGYDCVGPTVRDRAIVYDHIAGPEDLPVGWTDVHAPGEYRLARRDDDACFGYNVGPHAWKRFLFPPDQRLWRLRRQEGGFDLVAAGDSAPKFAFIGVRACELAALEIQDRVFFGGPFTDHHYKAVRESAFVVAASCTQSSATCFCTSMGTGPAVTGGCDIALTEVLAPAHLFLVEAHSEAGREVMDALPLVPATDAQREAAREGIEHAARQDRAIDPEGLPALLGGSYTSEHWERIAERCLSCANCTLVCPTCFCSDVEDVSDLTGEYAERWRRWDSCFNPEFSYLYGGEVRKSIASRYRQWLTHKLGTWVDQFGTSGCVGCGRCISWCPVGIDITAEVAALRASATAASESAAEDA
jgi:ferredoxin